MKNRRLPGTSQRLVALVAYGMETLKRNIALGNSREPLLSRLSVATRDRARCRQVLRYALKRLPSRPHAIWLLTPQQTPLPGIKYCKERALYATSELFICDSSKVVEKLPA